MKSTLTNILFFLLAFQNNAFSQNIDELKVINKDVWSNFTKAFETLDHQLFTSLHTDDFIRVSGNNSTIKTKQDYINGYANYWKNASLKQTISFRFLERIVNAHNGSERGIYKLTRNPNTPDEISYYGKFHVILKKENGVWKLLMDYDSSENNTIDETTYKNAYAMDEFDNY